MRNIYFFFLSSNMKLESSELQLILAKKLPSIVFAASRQDVPRY